MSNILLKLIGDSADAEATIDDTKAELKDFADQKYETALRVDAEQAKRDIAEVVAEMEAVPKEETIRLRVAGQQAQLEQLLARKQSLENALTQAAANGENTDPLIQRLGTVAQRIDTVRGRITQLSADFDDLGEEGTGILARLVAGFENFGTKVSSTRTSLLGLVGDLLGKIPLIGGLFETAFGAAENISAKLSTDMAGFVGEIPAMIAGFAEAAPIIAVVAAAVSALVVSLGEAILGVVALGVAFLAALGPIVVLLAVVADKIKDIVEGQYNLTTAQNNLKTATDNYSTSVKALHAAELNESNQRLAALTAEKQAVLALQQAEEQLQADRTNVQQTALGIQQAKLNLAQFLQNLAGEGLSPGDLMKAPSNVSVSGNFGQTQAGVSGNAMLALLLQYKQLTLDVTEAEEQHKQAQTTVLSDQLQLNSAEQSYFTYVKEGLRAYTSYADAVSQVTSDMNTVKTDALAVKNAQIQVTEAIKHGAGQSTTFMKAWDAIKHTFSVILGPAEQAAFGGIERAMRILAKTFDNKKVQQAWLDLGQAIGNAFVWWAKMMSKPDNEKLLVTLIRDAAKLTERMSQWFGGVFGLVVQIATDAMPKLLGAVHHWATWLLHIDAHQQSVRKFIDKCVNATETWWHRIQSVLGTFTSILTTLSKIIGLWDKFSGAVSTVAAVFAPSVASNQKLVQINQITQAGQIAQWEKDLRTGIMQAGPNAGKAISQALEQSIEANLRAIGVRYTGPVASVRGAVAKVEQHNHFTGSNVDAHHVAAVASRRLERKFRDQGGGVR